MAQVPVQIQVQPYVLLQCVKQGSKLRVKMMSSQPFIKGINCQFPRNIRKEGMYYIVKSDAIKLKGKFYSAMGKDTIACQTFNMEEVKKYINGLGATIKPQIIFGDGDDDNECAICMGEKKECVFSPCGHFMTCSGCSTMFPLCPICRAKIVCVLKRSEIKD
jgi:hypothetical protein